MKRFASASSQARRRVTKLSLEDVEAGLASGTRKIGLGRGFAQFGIARDEAYQAILAHEA